MKKNCCNIFIKVIFSICMLSCVICFSASAGERHLLENCITYEKLKSAIRLNQSWVAYPAYKDRKAWESIGDSSLREKIIRNGERALRHKWSPNLASDYLAFKRTGEIRTKRENHLALQALMLAELVEGKGRFMDTIMDGAWFLCETSWIHSAHLAFQKDQSGLPDRNEPTIELVVADIGAQMAWLHYFFKEELDRISPLIDKRIVETVNRNLIEPYFARNDYWWMGFTGQQVNNWNPWINYNVLQALMLIENNPDRICEGVWKLMRSTDFFFSMYHDDGACDEGPTYWSAASGYALKFLELLNKVTGNKVDIFNNQLVHNMAQYIYRIHIGKNYFVNFADSSPKVYPAPSVLYQFGKCIGDEKMKGFASFIAKQNHSFCKGVNGYFATALDELFMYQEIKQEVPHEPLISDYWFKDTQICVARDCEGTTDGFFFAAKGGHNQESHNHNDVGSCILYYDNNPILIDVGVGTYTRQTFGPERYKIWTMRSDYHNLPTINGIGQRNGKEYASSKQSYRVTPKKVTYMIDITDAYPKEAFVENWIRTYSLIRGKEFIIGDEWNLLKYCGTTYLNLLTCCSTEIDENMNLYLVDNGRVFQIEYNKSLFSIVTEHISLNDSKLKLSWNDNTLSRIKFIMKSQIKKGKSYLRIRKIR